MSATGLRALDVNVQKTHIWLNDILDELGWDDQQRAFHALRVVLHVVRDHLPLEEVAQLAAQFPQFIRGVYYEGWRPCAEPPRDRHWDQFVAHVENEFVNDLNAEPEMITRAVLRVLSKHISPGEITDVKRCLPEEIRRHWH
jgi:uncharacterized protein (DUF2267 family)